MKSNMKIYGYLLLLRITLKLQKHSVFRDMCMLFRATCIGFFALKALFKLVSEVKLLSRVRLFVTPWTVAYQAPPSMGFSRRECWSRLPFPSPGDLPDPGIEPGSPALQADALPSEPPGKPLKLVSVYQMLITCVGL